VSSPSEAAETASPTVTIGLDSHTVTSTPLDLSGAPRMATPSILPLVIGFVCGETNPGPRPTRDRFAYVEIKNPTPLAATVDVVLEGRDLEKIDLFAYASSTPPSTPEAGRQCLTRAAGVAEAFPGAGPSLEGSAGSGLVIPALGSVFVLVAAGELTGSYTLHTITRGFGTPERLTIVVPDAGGQTESTLLVGGQQRMQGGILPSVDVGFTCDGAANTSSGPDNYGWVEVKNESATDANVTVSVLGEGLGQMDGLAYTSRTPPTNSLDARHCLAVGESTGEQAARLATADGAPLVVPAHHSIFVLVATGSRTGAGTVLVSN
jgi:hypothetical protein